MFRCKQHNVYTSQHITRTVSTTVYAQNILPNRARDWRQFRSRDWRQFRSRDWRRFWSRDFRSHDFRLLLIAHPQILTELYPYTTGIRRVNLATNQVISHEWGKESVLTTNGTYPWSFVTQIFHSGHSSHGGDSTTFEVMTST